MYKMLAICSLIIRPHSILQIGRVTCESRLLPNIVNRRFNRNLVKSLSTSSVHNKKRKTAEERKAESEKGFVKKETNKVKLHGTVDVWRNISVEDLANCMKRSLEDVQETMLYVKGADNIEPSAKLEDMKIIREIITKCGMKCRFIAAPEKQTNHHAESKDKDVTPRPPAPVENLKPRAPVVTVMGHVDHGKTTLLDSLRGAAVAAGEAGGITQHIGAFTVQLEGGESVTFLDTPGHAAFSAMRSRGAHVTDIIVLVVAADDGVMAQTKEVIVLAQENKVPIIVAINKIDKPEADIERTKRDLMQMGLALEGYGGETQCVPISASKGTNLQQLAEAVSTQATLMNLKAEHVGLIEGVVVESKTDARRGKLSSAIVTRGTLRKGCVLVSGLAHAKVRGLFDQNGKPIDEAPPGTPVEILGWRELPLAGDLILEVESEKKAHSVLRYRNAENQKTRAESDLEVIRKKQEEHLAQYSAERVRRREIGMRAVRKSFVRPKTYLPDDGTPRVNIILKGDVHGSVEALLDVIETYHSNDKCRLDVVHYGVGDVSESDMELASTFKAIVYAFSVNHPRQTPKDVVIRDYNVIYHLIDDLKEEISKKLPPAEVEDVLGEATVLQTFMITEGKREMPVAGSRCIKGALKKNAKYKLIRKGEIIFDGELESMRHLKNEVESIKKDVECGLMLKDPDTIPENGDTLVCYTTHLKAQKTDWDPGF